MIEIKKMTKNHLDEVFTISKEEFGETCWTFVQFENALEGAYVLTLNNKVITFINTLNAIGELTILNLATKQEFKNKGFATQILKFIIEKAIVEKIEKIFLEVNTKNVPAINFYNKLGFSILRLRKNYYKDLSDCYEMALSI